MNTISELLEPVLTIDEIQGNILGGFNKDHQAVIPLQFADDKETVTAVRQWLSEFVKHITWLREVAEYRREFKRRIRNDGVEPTDMIALWKNIAFSFPGLSKLTEQAEGFTDNIFKKGLAEARGRLGDPLTPGLPGHIDSWLIGQPDTIPDILVIIAGDDPTQVEDETEAFLSEARQVGLICPMFDIGHDLTFYNRGTLQHEPGREHFGFKDGISQPAVRGRLSERADDFLSPRSATNNPDPNEPEFDDKGQPLICVGEFVFGYGRQNDSFPRQAVVPYQLGPKPYAFDANAIAPYWAANGSFLVYRRLQQDVPAFNRFLESQARQLAQKPEFEEMTSEKLGALLVGRWRSGSPVLRSPTQDNVVLGRTSPANNLFNYEQDLDVGDAFGLVVGDPDGVRCPLAAHIRKVNPRARTTEQGSPSKTLLHRTLRRGIPYGSPLPLGATSDESTPQERGLLFLSYQISIREQFEFLARQWMNDSSKPFATEAGFDLVVGQNPRRSEQRQRFCILKEGDVSERISTDGQVNDWVIPRGGGYFFAPSRSAIVEVLSS